MEAKTQIAIQKAVTDLKRVELDESSKPIQSVFTKAHRPYDGAL